MLSASHRLPDICVRKLIGAGTLDASLRRASGRWEKRGGLEGESREKSRVLSPAVLSPAVLSAAVLSRSGTPELLRYQRYSQPGGTQQSVEVVAPTRTAHDDDDDRTAHGTRRRRREHCRYSDGCWWLVLVLAAILSCRVRYSTQMPRGWGGHSS